MKLIIEIPETMTQELKDGCFGVKHNVYELVGCIMNGIPLDKIIAEIMKLQTYKMFYGEDTVYNERDDVLAIIDKYIRGTE